MKKLLKRSLSAVLASAMIICLMLGASVTTAAAGMAGDANCDGSTDNKDVLTLFRYLSGALNDNDVDLIACDTNGDGKTNNKDVTVLFRHLSDSSVAIYYGMPNVYTQWDSNALKCFTNPKQTTVALDDDGIRLTYAKASGLTDPYVIFNVSKYAKAVGKPELTGEYGAYIVLKVLSNADGYIEVFTQSPAAGDSSSAIYKADGKFHYVIVDMTDTTLTTPKKLSTVRFDWAGGESTMKNGVYMIISEIGFFKDLDSALTYTNMSEEEYEIDYEPEMPIPPEGDMANYVTSNSGATIERFSDDGAYTALIKSTKTPVRFTVDLRAISDYYDKYVEKGMYLGLRVRAGNQISATIQLTGVTDVSGYMVSVTDQTCEIDCANNGWQGVMFNLRDVAVYKKILKKLSFTVNSFTTSGSIEIGGIAVSDNINDVLVFCGHPEYCLNYDETLTDNDELATTVLTAENEDSSLKLWFDQSTEKTLKTDTESTGRTGYTVRMAKNEAENCQFFLAPARDLNARIEIEDFTNSNGDTVPFEAFYEYYHNVTNALRPDAIPPLTGPVEIKSGNSQGFVIQLTTTADTPAGLYESVIHVYDNDTGSEIKRAAVAVKVWNFELSEKTELRTAFALWSISSQYNWDAVPFSQTEVNDNYYEFFLKYRINIMDIPHGLTSSYANRFMSTDRVNTARWTNLDMSVTEDNGGVTPVWMDKVIYYPGDLDEPRADWQFALFKSFTDRIKANTPDYRMVIPFERDCDLTADGKITTFTNASVDSIEFMKDYVDIWCPETFSFTTRDLGFISRTTFLQSKEQDAKYGTFIDRMNKEVEEGDELWAYVCINPRPPYANWKIDTDGTETIVSLWQMKEYNVTGMLYWAVNYYKVNYMDETTPWAFPNDGDGILIYSGYEFGGLPTPVSTLRLESIRDGIEDYQMLCMLEEALGEEAANDMISRITTSVVTFATDDDYIHAVRVLLGDTLEEALNH